ncbi:MAG: ABC-2 family transporter protein [Spirochaetales bacterium]|nr:ABC-2 family transporter protein [Spirochaetales bacterium]
MDWIKLYGSYAAQSIKAQLEYRASLIMQIVGQFLVNIIEFSALWALFTRFGNLDGWTLEEAAFCYGLVGTIFSLADFFTRGFDIVGKLVQSGEFDRYLLRPRSLLLQLFGYELSLRRIGRLSQGLLILLWAISRLSVHWTAGKILLLLYTLPCGVAFFTSFLIIQASLSIKSVQSLEFMNVLTYGGVQTAQYPLSVYTDFFRRFFTFVVPLGCVTYYPVLVILDRTDSLLGWARFGWISPLGGPLFLLLSLLLFRRAIGWYVSTGS